MHNVFSKHLLRNIFLFFWIYFFLQIIFCKNIFFRNIFVENIWSENIFGPPIPYYPPPMYNTQVATSSYLLFEVEGGGTNETNEGLTDRTEHAMIAPFIITDFDPILHLLILIPNSPAS